MSTWQDVTTKVEAITFTMTMACDHCALPIPLNGPMREARCGNCQRTTKVTTLGNELNRLHEGYHFPNFACAGKLVREAGPQCRKCGGTLSIYAWKDKVGARMSLPCPHCGAGIVTYPAPDWMRETLPNALQIFGGEPPDDAKAQGLALEVDQVAPKPIAMACPQCAGGLLIQASDERVVECRYCKASVFLPDELWRRLHPAKTVCAWTLTFTGSLKTADELRRREQEALREREREERAEAQRKRSEEADRQRTSEEERARERARLEDARRQRRLYIFAAAFMVAAFAVVLYMLKLEGH